MHSLETSVATVKKKKERGTDRGAGFNQIDFQYILNNQINSCSLYGGKRVEWSEPKHMCIEINLSNLYSTENDYTDRFFFS